MDWIKIKYSCYAKDTVKRMKGQATDWEKIVAKLMSDEGLLSKYTNKYNNSKIRKEKN